MSESEERVPTRPNKPPLPQFFLPHSDIYHEQLSAVARPYGGDAQWGIGLSRGRRKRER
jgi:hypothetical protein